MSDEVKTKVCSKCKTEKVVAEFGKVSRNKDGSNGRCRLCVAECSRKYYAENTEKAKESRRKWRKANPEKKNKYTQKWRKANPEKVDEVTRKWKKTNSEKVYEASKKWRKANPEKVAERNRLFYQTTVEYNLFLKNLEQEEKELQQ